MASDAVPGREQEMSTTSRVGAAVAAGYFLGRFKKLRLALMVGSALANKNVRSSGLGMLHQGTKTLTSSPEAKKLTEQITSQLMEAGKAAAVTAAASRIDKLSDKLNERSSGLRGMASMPTSPESEDQADEQPDDQADEQPQDQADEQADQDEAGADEQPQDEADEDEQPEDQADADE